MTDLTRAPESPPSTLHQAVEWAVAAADKVTAEVRDHRQELLFLGLTLVFVALVSVLGFLALAG